MTDTTHQLDLDLTQRENQRLTYPQLEAKLGILHGTMHSAKALGLLYGCQDFQRRCKSLDINQRELGLYMISQWVLMRVELAKTPKALASTVDRLRRFTC